MYSSSPIPSYAIMDRRPTLGTMDSSHQHQQSWAPPTILKQQQDTDMNYMVHHGYHVTPTTTSSSLQYHQHHLLSIQQPSSKQQMNRAVIPSKRAAQNRAAQKAFRQRRDQYVKDLEKKSKEMEHWKQELDNMKDENQQLKTLVHQLQQRISSLVDQQNEIPSTSPPSSPSMPTLSASSLDPHSSSSPSPTTSPLMSAHPPTTSISSPSHHSLLPISLRPHSFLPLKDDSPTVSSASSSSHIHFGAASVDHVAASDNILTGRATLELDLDPFFDDDYGFPRIDDQLDFVGHTSGGQVLDDLFTMLQTRQRPQIPLQPPQQQNDPSPTHYYLMDQHMPNHDYPST